ncbi:hypothetical protein AciX9_3561 [Granulicella tundricola MP5ACTX9]|uniref:Uncharacterized protein n=1 Tax=Granulicella tundricola (strain ATCC BAA-1859 / DSM 23138 / MP5ACTX9) TaxID=1198114 RepID=E8X4S6_GRATM|nr:hypothetical protein AciX9_3561 [Granulicella tundricola MP5ACTX9]
MFRDLFYLLVGFLGFFCLAALGWEVGGGDLEAVEEEAGAAVVELVGGDAAQDLADGELDGGSVFGEWQIEGGVAVLVCVTGCQVGAWDGFAGGVVVVAEVLVAEGWTAAAASVGVDVAALVACGCFDCLSLCGHGWGSPPPVKVCKVFRRLMLWVDFFLSTVVHCQLWRRGFSSSYEL